MNRFISCVFITLAIFATCFECNKLDVSFDLYTQASKDQYIHIDYNLNLTNNVPKLIDHSKPVFFIVHGFDSYSQKPEFVDTKNELLENIDGQILLVDWSQAADTGLNYVLAQSRVKPVGRLIAKFIKFMKIKPSNVHCIGHSLGAHLCGHFGKAVAKEAKLKRITALDPAGPLYETNDCNKRLCPEDANYVDVIHSSAGIGLGRPVGHKDFYPNGGIRIQPGCQIVSPEFFLVCSHKRSIDFFEESINSKCKFTSVGCSSWDAYKKGYCKCGVNGETCARMGYHSIDEKSEGSFYLYTGGRSPYCQH